MKLYAFYPKGHGSYSFFVQASSEQEAMRMVSEYIKDHHTDEKGWFKYEAYGWGTEEYIMQVFEPGQVAENPND